MIFKNAARSMAVLAMSMGILAGSTVVLSQPQAEAQSVGSSIKTVNDSYVGKGAKCKANVTVVGVRGSSESMSGGGNIYGFGNTVTSAAKHLNKHLRSGTAVRYKTVSYPATLPHNSLALARAGKPTAAAKKAAGIYQSSKDKGVSELSKLVKQLANDCSKTKIVLMGYSQGAHVVHHALATRASSQKLNSKQLGQVKGVLLISDPIRIGMDTSARTWWNGHYTARDSSSGVLTKWMGSSLYLPSALKSKTVSICRPKDPVCNVSKSSLSSKDAMKEHTSYARVVSTFDSPVRAIAKQVN